MAYATPFSSLLKVMKSPSFFISSLALSITTETPAFFKISTSLRLSPIAIVSSIEMPKYSAKATSPLAFVVPLTLNSRLVPSEYERS